HLADVEGNVADHCDGVHHGRSDDAVLLRRRLDAGVWRALAHRRPALRARGTVMAEASTTSLPESKWYIVHTYSNFEKKVSEEIRRQAQIQGLSDLVEEVMVPTEEVVEVRRGQKHNAERKFLPGYVLVCARLTDEAYHLIK